MKMKVVLKCNDEAEHSTRRENQYYAAQLFEPPCSSTVSHVRYQADLSDIVHNLSLPKINLNFWLLDSKAEIFVENVTISVQNVKKAFYRLFSQERNLAYCNNVDSLSPWPITRSERKVPTYRFLEAEFESFFVFFNLGGGTLGIAATYWPIVPAPNDR
jgi:hypothetical protein